LQTNWGFIVSFVLVVLGIVGVFIDIPFVSDYAYWFVIAGYVILAGSRFRRRVGGNWIFVFFARGIIAPGPIDRILGAPLPRAGCARWAVSLAALGEAAQGIAYLSGSSNSLAHIMFCVRETATEQ
jgi:hypothetical protein